MSESAQAEAIRRVEAALARLTVRLPVGPVFESELRDELEADGWPSLSVEQIDTALEALAGEGRVTCPQDLDAHLDIVAEGFGEVLAAGDLFRAEILLARAFEVADARW